MRKPQKLITEVIALTIWNRDFVLLLIINTVWSFGGQILNPVLPLYAAGIASAESQLGYLVAAFALASMCIRPFSGLIADRFDRKKVLIGTQVLCAVNRGLQMFTAAWRLQICARSVQTCQQ